THDFRGLRIQQSLMNDNSSVWELLPCLMRFSVGDLLHQKEASNRCDISCLVGVRFPRGYQQRGPFGKANGLAGEINLQLPRQDETDVTVFAPIWFHALARELDQP